MDYPGDPNPDDDDSHDIIFPLTVSDSLPPTPPIPSPPSDSSPSVLQAIDLMGMDVSEWAFDMPSLPKDESVVSATGAWRGMSPVDRSIPPDTGTSSFAAALASALASVCEQSPAVSSDGCSAGGAIQPPLQR